MNKDSKIYIAGHNGMVGRNLLNELTRRGFKNLIYRTSSEVDLRDQSQVQQLFRDEKPDYVFLVAAKVGGIKANINEPVQFLQDNLEIQTNIIKESHRNNVTKLLFLSSSCIYPRDTSQPMAEHQILTGPFEPTNEGYAIAKVAGMKLCQYYNKQYQTNYITVIPPNLYGYHDHYNLETSHVLSALITKFHHALINNLSTVEIWGTGNARREFMFTEDLVDGLLFLMDVYSSSLPINLGTGVDISIKELANTIARIVGFKGELKFDLTKPDGMPQKLMDVSTIKNLGWTHKINLEEGIRLSYNWYLKHIGV